MKPNTCLTNQITPSEKQMTEEPNAEKANNETTKKKTCHNRHTNQIRRLMRLKPNVKTKKTSQSI